MDEYRAGVRDRLRDAIETNGDRCKGEAIPFSTPALLTED